MTVQTTGSFTFAKWEENQVGQAAGEEHPKLAHASVTNDFSGGITAAGASCEYTLLYITEKHGVFSGMQLFSGSLDGRSGTFVVREEGTFDESGVIRCAFEVVPGSGTGDLAGLTGSGSFVAREGSRTTPYTFTYELG